MKTCIISIHFLLFFITCAYPQSGWFQQNVPQDINMLLSIYMTDVNHGTACGWSNYDGRAIYTTNGGSDWLLAQVPDSSRSLVTVQFLNSQTGYIAGAYNIQGYENNRIVKPGSKYLIPSNKLIRGLYKKIGMDTNAVYKGFFLRSTNTGASWLPYGKLPDSIYYLIGLWFINPGTGFVTADKSVTSGLAAILRTTNAGVKWSVTDIPPGIATLWGIYFFDENTGFAYGYRHPNDTLFQSVLLRTTNSGGLWIERNFADLQNITSLDFTNYPTGFFTGSTEEPFGVTVSRIYTTMDGGLNWELGFQLSGAVFSGIRCLRQNGTGIIFGNFPDTAIFVSKTTDYGYLWTTYSNGNISGLLNSGSLADQNNWYICGGNFSGSGIILKTTNAGEPIGIIHEGENVSAEFKLSQNYPNPFNSKTIIDFDIPANVKRETSKVKLVIYDLLGREVSTLINEVLKPGRYSVVWDGSNYASGVYFYKLMVGALAPDGIGTGPLSTTPVSVTKKLVLLK